MEKNPTRICELIVGLGDVEFLGVEDAPGGPLELHVWTRTRPACGGCGGAAWSKGSAPVSLVDLPAFGRPVRLVWHKWRWRCPAAGCGVGSFTEVDELIASARAALTTRAGVAAELGCDWHTVNRAVLTWGEALLAADCDRVGAVEALGLDETLFGRQDLWRTRRWCTSIVDVTRGQLLDIVGGRDAEAPIRWLLDRPEAWRQSIDWGVLDLSGAYGRSFEVALPHAGQVAGPFHVVRLANNSIDEVRRRTQNDTFGHRGRKHDPLWRARQGPLRPNRVSSRPSASTAPTRAVSAASSASPQASTARFTVCQSQPNSAATSATGRASRPTAIVAQRPARAVNAPRAGAIRSSTSVNEPTGHPASTQHQRHLRHTRRTGRPNAGRSTNPTGAEPFDHTAPPQPPQAGRARVRMCTPNGPPDTSSTPSTSTSPRPTINSQIRVGFFSTGGLLGIGVCQPRFWRPPTPLPCWVALAWQCRGWLLAAAGRACRRP